MRKVFLENLPRKGKLISWKYSIDNIILFIYDGIEGEMQIINYEPIYQFLTVKYNNIEFKIKTGNLMNCQIGKVLGQHTSEFKIEIGTKFIDDKRDIIITERKTEKRKHGNSIVNEKLYKYKCNRCGFDCGEHWNIKTGIHELSMWKSESNILKGDGCSSCNNTSIIVKGINDIDTTHPHLVEYFVNIEDSYKYSHLSNKNVNMICPFCKTVRMMRINKITMDGFSCKKCGDGISYPNKFMFNMLEQLNINFETEYSPEWIKPKRYDFYIPSKNVIIEMDGALGHGNKDNNLSGQTAEESKAIDDEKDRLAIEYGIEVIRVDCKYSTTPKRFQYIKNNILSNIRINELFNISKIDWMSIDLQSNNSNIKVFYSFLQKGCSRKEIIKYMKIGQTTYYNYYNIIKELEI